MMDPEGRTPDADEEGARAVRDAVAEAERLIGEGRPRRALDVLGRVRPVAPDDPDLIRLEAQARRAVEELDQRMRVRPLVDQARKLSVRGDLDAALAAAEEAVQAAPDDARALRLRDELQERVEEVRRAAPATGLAAGSQARAVPRERIRTLLASASARLARDDIEGAEREAQEALESAPAEADTLALVERIRARRRELERPRRIETLVADATRLLEAGRFQACLALVVQLAKLEPDHTAAASLRVRAEEGLGQAEARRAALRAALTEGQAALAAGDLTRAIDRFTAILAEDASHAEARRGVAEARARVGQRERIGALLAAARAHLARDAIEAADRDVQEALRLEPQGTEPLALSEAVWARGRELRRARQADAPRVPPAPPAAERHPTGVAGLAAEDRTRQGADEVREVTAPAPVPEAPTQDSVRESLADAERWIGAGRPERALDALARVRTLAPEHPELGRLEAQAQRAAQERDVRGRVRALLDRAGKLAMEGKLEAALAAAEEAVGAAPDDARALRLRDELQDRLRVREQRGR